MTKFQNLHASGYMRLFKFVAKFWRPISHS